MQQARTQLMTEGPIWRRILVFSIPLIVGSLLQQLYNTVDTLVIGNFLGGDALAAVGAGTTIIHLLLSLFAGLSTGASVVIAQYYGARNDKMVRRAVRTTAAFTLVSGIALTVLGVWLSGEILSWIGTPASVFRDARLYLAVYFAGILPLMVYNMGAAVLRAVGDSRTPLYYLAAAALVNTVLDVLFVAVFDAGVGGVALATFIAQTAAALLVLAKMQHTRDVYRLDTLKALRTLRTLRPSTLLRTPQRPSFHGMPLDLGILRNVLRIGIPAGLQQTAMAISNLVVQSTINSFGTVAMAAWNVYGKLDGMVVLPVISFGLAMTTFTGQNIGAGMRDRVLRGTKTGLWMSCAFAVAISALVCAYGVDFLRIFTAEAEILEYGRRMIFGLAPYYFLIAVMYALSGVVNGAGFTLPTMGIMLASLCVVRIACLKLTTHFLGDIRAVFAAYIVSWSVCCVGLAAYYIKGRWRTALDRTSPPRDPAEI